jgi:hypothetical protein
MTQRLLDLAGIGGERLHLVWVSSAEAQRFVEVTTSVLETVQQCGKFDPARFKLQLEAVTMTLNGEPLRWTVGKAQTLTAKGDVYGRKWEKQRFESVLDTMLEREYTKNLIFVAIKEGFTSVRDISGETGLELRQVSFLLAELEKSAMVEFVGMEESKPVFAAM